MLHQGHWEPKLAFFFHFSFECSSDGIRATSLFGATAVLICAKMSVVLATISFAQSNNTLKKNKY